MAKKNTYGAKKRSKSNRAKKSLVVKILGKALRYAVLAVCAFVAISVSGVIAYRFINPPYTPLMMIRSFEGVKMQTERRWTPYEQIPQSMIDAVVASEDNKFAEHSGFDFDEMREAHRQNSKRKYPRGASTITQQMCKNVFLWNRRSYIRKGLEAWFTVWVELLWSKQRIMEVYLNVIEMGNGVYGISAAAQTYYRKPPAKLSREEAAMIAATLPSPRKRNPAKPSTYMLSRQQQILDLMGKIGTVKL